MALRRERPALHPHHPPGITVTYKRHDNYHVFFYTYSCGRLLTSCPIHDTLLASLMKGGNPPPGVRSGSGRALLPALPAGPNQASVNTNIIEYLFYKYRLPRGVLLHIIQNPPKSPNGLIKTILDDYHQEANYESVRQPETEK